MIQKQNCDLNQNNYNLFAIEEQCMYSKVFKRIIDFILSFFALVILSPLFILLIIIGALVMKGNPFFVQERPGRNETIFKLIKFRTMTNVKDDQGNLLPDNERNSRYGNFLRKTSLDELGELLNIIKGDMSIIGPRPLLVRYLPYYTENERHRHDVRPGLTGWAQINGRNFITWEEIFSLDVFYVNHLSFIDAANYNLYGEGNLYSFMALCWILGKISQPNLLQAISVFSVVYIALNVNYRIANDNKIMQNCLQRNILHQQI